VIVLKINISHVLPVHAERQPKISGHPNAPIAASAAFQGMQLPSGELRNLLDGRACSIASMITSSFATRSARIPRPSPVS
jgi:hypothetical protein